MPDAPEPTLPPERSLSEQQRARIHAELAAAAQPQKAWHHERWVMPGLAAAAVTAIIGGGAYAANLGSDASGPRTPVPLHPDSSSTGIPPTPTAVPPTPTAVPTSTTSVPTSSTGVPTTADPTTTTPQVVNNPTVSPATPVPSVIAPSTPALPPMTTRPGSETSSAVPPLPVTPGSTDLPTGPTDLPTGPFPPVSCDDEVVNVPEPSLRGAAVTAQRDYGPGTTYLYETKTAWVVCDDLTAAGDGGVPTLLALHEKTESYSPDLSTLAVSENLITRADGSWAYDQFVAAGRDFDGVRAISYSFPDGHTEDAVVGQNGLWSMTYLATDGVFTDPKTNETTLDPITVTVHDTDGDVHSFTLRWGLDTCAQLNHGC